MRAVLTDVLGLIVASLRTMAHALAGRGPQIVTALVVFLSFLGAGSVVRWAIRRATRETHRANVGIVLGRLAYFTTVLVGLLVGVTIVAPSMTPARLVSLLGIGGVAIGFAFKDLFQNLLAGILLLWRQPFRVGDEITSSAFTGTVEAIETRATFIKTYDGRRIIIPNSQIYTDAVSVITAYDMLRSEYDVGIGYAEDIARAKEVLREILESTEGILRAPPPEVFTWDLAESTVNIRVRWWSKPDRPTVVLLRDRVLQSVRERFREEGIDLPFPTRVLLVRDGTEEADVSGSRRPRAASRSRRRSDPRRAGPRPYARPASGEERGRDPSA